MMPSAAPPSFNISQTLFCEECREYWHPTMIIPLTERRRDETVETALKKALYASECVLFSYLSMNDLEVDDRVLSTQIRLFQGEIKIHCKRNKSNRTCPNCLYPTASRTALDEASRKDDRLTITFSITSDTQPDPSRTATIGMPSNIIDSSVASVSPLNENPPDLQEPTYYPRSVDSSSSIPPIPAPRSLMLHRPVPDPLNGNLGTLRSQDTTYFGAMPASTRNVFESDHDNHFQTVPQPCDDVYLEPSMHMPDPQSIRPPLPPRNPSNPLQNLFTCPEPRSVARIRDALRRSNINGLYALVKSPKAVGGAMNTPYILFCEQLEDKFKTVFECTTRSGTRWFIHRDRDFDSLEELLAFYRHHPTKCNTTLSRQLTRDDLRRFVNGN